MSAVVFVYVHFVNIALECSCEKEDKNDIGVAFMDKAQIPCIHCVHIHDILYLSHTESPAQYYCTSSLKILVMTFMQSR